MLRYLIRLDDACPTMHADRWDRIEQLLDKYGISPLVGVIPNNEDETQRLSNANTNFWDLVKAWENKGWTIALHGYNHCYTSSNAGIHPMWNKSEFAGIPLDLQKEKIKKGINIFRTHGFNPKVFFAPSHTFDLNTLQALKEESDIRIISDGIALTPYRFKDFMFIPQICGRCRNIPVNGVYTFCYHPNMMQDKDFIELESFITKYKHSFVPFSSLITQHRSIRTRNWLDVLLHNLYFTFRKFRRALKK